MNTPPTASANSSSRVHDVIIALIKSHFLTQKVRYKFFLIPPQTKKWQVLSLLT